MVALVVKGNRIQWRDGNAYDPIDCQEKSAFEWGNPPPMGIGYGGWAQIRTDTYIYLHPIGALSIEIVSCVSVRNYY